MKKIELLAASAIALVAALPAHAQTGNTTSSQNTAPTNGPGQEAPSSTPTDTQPAAVNQGYGGDIVVTAQRQSQRLQDVPIAVSAFTAENLEKQQIVNPLALQQTLPNVTFTKGQFASSTFTIRGIGDLCVGVTCDSATGIAMNEMPIPGTRQLDNEFFDMERIEVLRGPQGTLFGRNATSGVVDLITAKPDLSGIHSAGEFEYGNYKSYKVKGMINLPITDTFGVRVAGYYLNRDGYTYNTYTDSRIDGRNMYSLRGSVTWEPTPDTRIDFIGTYTKESDDRSRIQKQLCDRDPTGVLGCLPTRLTNGTTNFNSTLGGATESAQGLPLFLADALVPQNISSQAAAATYAATFAGTAAALRGVVGPFGLGSVGSIGIPATPDVFANVINPADPRTVTVDYLPTYRTEEQIYTLKLYHNFGDIALNVTAGHTYSRLNTTSDYNLAVEAPISSIRNPLTGLSGLTYLDLAGQAPGSPFAAVRNALIPNGANGPVCQSNNGQLGVGVYGGETIGCYNQSLDFDRSTAFTNQWVGEAHLDSSFDGPFNFLLGGIYLQSKSRDVDYYVNSFALDYISGLAGSLTKPGNFLASPGFHSNSDRFTLKSWGAFGETYFEFNDKLKLTLGARLNHDDKYVSARTTLLNVPLPVGTTNANPAFDSGAVDFDSTVAGNQPFAVNRVKYTRVTGRAVLDYKITPNNMIYASYSRGYKSGGINPPLSPIFNVPTTFRPESVDAYEIGTKNTFMGGALRLNLTGFYYKYKDLQLTRIVARTSVNDNISANIYGVEAEAIISPVPAFVVNANFSYLKSKVADDRFLVNPRDVSGGRGDAVIIKDLTAAYNCVVLPTNGSAATAQGFVNAANAQLGLNPSAPLLANGTYGAYSACKFLQASQVATNAPVTVLLDGNPVNVKDNQLPNSPTYKWSVGAQYTIDAGNFTIVPRADINYTGGYFGTIFNLNPIDRIPGYEVVNAQVQLNGPDDRWYLRGFVTNLTNNNAITGMYVTDQSSGLYTNVFTIEPRRYGVAAGFKF